MGQGADSPILGAARSVLPVGRELCRIELILLGAKLAIDVDRTVFSALFYFVGREAGQDRAIFGREQEQRSMTCTPWKTRTPCSWNRR